MIEWNCPCGNSYKFHGFKEAKAQELVAIDAQCDRFYLRGLQAGFSLGQMGDEAGFAAACRSYQKHLTEASHGIKE